MASHERSSTDFADKLSSLRLRPALLPSFYLVLNSHDFDVLYLGDEFHEVTLMDQTIQGLAAVNHERR